MRKILLIVVAVSLITSIGLSCAPEPEPEPEPEEEILCTIIRDDYGVPHVFADTKEGIYIEGRGNYSIDQLRYNFQFGGEMFWEIKNGKKARVLKNVLYGGITTEFWGSCDAICNEKYWRPFGVTSCAKGQPVQIHAMSHGSAHARFRNIKVGV